MTALIFLVIVEGALGLYSLRYAKKFQDLYRKPKRINILCIGKSTTHIGGENSYPSQLQKLLDLSHPETFHVINAGLAGAETRYFATRIESILSGTQPQIMIAMLGINDEGSNFHKREKKSWLQKLVNKSFIYRYFQNYQELNEFIGHPEQYYTFSNYLKRILREEGIEYPLVPVYTSLEIKDYQTFKNFFHQHFKKMPFRLSFGRAAIYLAENQSYELMNRLV